MSLADEENVQPLLSEQDVETGQPRSLQPEEGIVNETEAPVPDDPSEPEPEEPEPEEPGE